MGERESTVSERTVGRAVWERLWEQQGADTMRGGSQIVLRSQRTWYSAVERPLVL